MTWQPVLTKEARTACNRKRYNNPIAFADVSHFRPGLFDHSHELVTDDHVFELREEPIVDVQIGAADCGGSNSHNNILRIFYSWILDLIDFDATWAVVNDSFHLLISSLARGDAVGTCFMTAQKARAHPDEEEVSSILPEFAARASDRRAK